MAAGFLQVVVKDGNGTNRNVKFWSSDGTLSGDLTPAHMVRGDDGGSLVGQKGDVAWDGAAGTPSWTALVKYIATKIEAMRAILDAQISQVYDYVKCPASATTALGTAGAIGDVLASLVVIPSSTSPGAVQIKDGTDAAITVFAGGNLSQPNLTPVTIVLNLRSKSGGWSIVTNGNESVLASGSFTNS